MQKLFLVIRPVLICLFLLCCNSALLSQTTEIDSKFSAEDLKNAGTITEKLSSQFTEDYLKGDSLALADFYAKDAQFGSLKGKEILAYWGRSVRNSIKNNTRNLTFKSSAVTGDSDFVVEMGKYEIKNDDNKLIHTGKYLVVWKKQDGKWKIYRDMGL